MISYEVRFAENLKRLRRERNMTQRALAEALGFSEKTVSKWECAASIPDIAALFSVAQILHTSVEELFRTADESWYLGIDGGGTKTAFALANESGEIVRTLYADSCNPFDIGLERAKAVLRDGIFRITEQIPLSCVSCFAGIAGGSLADMKSALADFFREFHFRAVRNDTDNLNIISAGLRGRDGVTLILGTGICAFTRQGSAYSRVGGWGYLFDDGGSAYNIGRDALNAYYCALDGSGAPTAITAGVTERCPDTAPEQLLSQLYDGGKKKIASFAPVAIAAAEQGDVVAMQILKRNMAVAAHLVETAAAKLEQPRVPVVLAGGLTAQPIIVELLRESLRDPARIQLEILQEEPVQGAVLLARELSKQEND